MVRTFDGNQLRADTLNNIQLGAGVLCRSINMSTGEISGILGATSGGVKFTATPAFKDFGEDIDNAKKNMKDFKWFDGWDDVKLAGSYIAVTPKVIEDLVCGSHSWVTEPDTSENAPANQLLFKHVIISPLEENGIMDASNFDTLFWAGNYSAGSVKRFMVIQMFNTLNTSGFSFQSADAEKGKFDFEYTAHYKIGGTVPFKIYVNDTTDLDVPENIVGQREGDVVRSPGTTGYEEET